MGGYLKCPACLATLKSCDTTKKISLWMTIYALPSWALSTLSNELTAATSVMQSLPNELSTPVSNSAKCKQTNANTKCVIIPELMHVTEMADWLYTMSSIKLGACNPEFLAIRMSCDSTKQPVWDHNIYIYIYIYIYIRFMFLTISLSELMENQMLLLNNAQ